MLVSFPGARDPDRTRRVDSAGLSIAVHEWGGADAPPLLLAHGGFDFARTYDVFAPLLADAGWRVVAWDHRGHGDSDRAALYSWDADVRDAYAVLCSTTDEPCPIIGHSKGAGLMLQLADAIPHRITKVVNMDGLPSEWAMPDVSDHERTRMMAASLTQWLDRRRIPADTTRKPGTLDELATRRARMNPRLPIEWLRHLASVGAFESEDGWRWKLDPLVTPGGFGPWRPSWSLERLPAIGAPFLGILATVQEAMGMGTTEAGVRPWLPADSELIVLEDTGHFVHIERPHEVAGHVLDFLGPPA